MITHLHLDFSRDEYEDWLKRGDDTSRRFLNTALLEFVGAIAPMLGGDMLRIVVTDGVPFVLCLDTHFIGLPEWTTPLAQHIATTPYEEGVMEDETPTLAIAQLHRYCPEGGEA